MNFIGPSILIHPHRMDGRRRTDLTKTLRHVWYGLVKMAKKLTFEPTVRSEKKIPRYQQDQTKSKTLRHVWYCLVWFGAVKMAVNASEPTVRSRSFFPMLTKTLKHVC